MLDGIDFLENLGQDAQLRYASQDEVEFALSKAVVEPAMRVAILAKNGPGLQALLGQEPFCCLINPAKPSDEQGSVTAVVGWDGERRDDKVKAR